MREFHAGTFDIAVIGAGHAGIEAALAAARMGLETVCFTMNLDAVGNMPCNPAIGGTGKGHLVRELDALGGEMGAAADDTFIQIRMLNTGKGPAVHSLRAQMDKRRYHERMKRALEREPLLDLRMGECERILLEKGAKEFGIHAFLASNTTTDDYYPTLAMQLFRLAVELHEETGAHIGFINLSLIHI